MPGGREYPSRPIVGAAVLIPRRGRLLLIRRKRDPNMGLWSIPGGLVELGESPAEAAVREAMEETGLAIKVDRVIGVANDIHSDGTGRTRYHFIVIDYLASSAKGRVRLNGESSSFGWFLPRQLASLEMPENLRKLLASFLHSDSLVQIGG